MDGRLQTLLPLEVMSSCGCGCLPKEHCMVPHLSTFRVMWLSTVNLLMPSIACCNPLVGGVRGSHDSPTVISSTYSHLWGVSTATWLTIVRKTTGPTLVPCGTPQVVEVRPVM